MNFLLANSAADLLLPSAARVAVTIGVIALDDQRRLALTCRGTNCPWEIPGGRLDGGESVEAAALRIFFRETGVKIRLTYLLGIYSDPLERLAQDPEDTDLVHEVNILLEAHLLHQAPPPPAVAQRGRRLGFFPAERLPTPLAARAVAPLQNYLHGHVGIVR